MLGLKRQSKSSSVLRRWKSAALVRRLSRRSWRTLSSSWSRISRNSSWLRRLAAASCKRRLTVPARPESRSCLSVVSKLGMLISNQLRVGVALGSRAETDRHQIVIGFQVADERVSFDKGELFLSHGPGQQFPQVSQMPSAMSQGQLAGLVELRGGMFLGQCQESLQDAQAFSAALLVKGFGPCARALAQQPAAVQDPIGPSFDQRAFMVVDVSWIGFELSGLLAHMDGDDLHALVEQANYFGIPARPDFSSQLLRRNRVISFVHFRVAIAVDFTRSFAKDRKQAGRQRQELELLDGQKMRAHLLAGGAVNAGVGHGFL